MAWSEVAAVGLGGAIGAISRYAANAAIKWRWPEATFQATFVVNLMGSFLIGIALARLIPKQQAILTAFLMTGVLGGFTTFSAFSADNFSLLKSGQWGLLVLNSFGQVVGGILAAALGIACMGGLKQSL
ncbi:CrcB family protein [Kamptonema cortianum]|nr:CrcB family protein [Geitlerinema splendidum]MDK3155293.1 CrcB family protein [Kamptonema cortianum]